MLYTKEQLETLKIYRLHFWDGEHLKVTTKQAALVKFAKKQGMDYFELGEDMYMMKDLKRIERDSRFEQCREEGMYEVESEDHWNLLSTNFYLLPENKSLLLPGKGMALLSTPQK